MADARILLINDDNDLSIFLREKLIVDGGYSVTVEASGAAGIEAYRGNGYSVVIVKFDMQFLDINGLVESLRKIDPEVIIIALLKEEAPSLLRQINHLGIYAYLLEPIKEEELFFLIDKGDKLHKLALVQHKLTDGLKEQNVSLQKQNSLLAKRLEESTKNLTRLYEDLRSTYMRTIKALAQTIDARDHYTHSHSENVAKYSVIIAEEMHLPAKDIEIIREACELHDLGKIGIPDNILIKPEALTSEEWKIMKRHPITGAEILEPLTFLHSVIDLIRQHHEHYDGSGYPKGLKADEISLGARIIHLSDAYEAMTSARSYRKTPFSKEYAIEEIKKNQGTQFDPKIADVFLKVVDSF